MTKLKTHAALAAALAGAVVLGAATPSFAGGNDAAVAAGVGFAAGTVVGAAAANANANANGYNANGYYNEPGYMYAPGPGYVYAPGPGYVYAPAPGYAYAPRAYAYAPGPTIGFGLNGDIGNDAYVNGRYVGSDPDPRIRATLRAEAKSKD